MTPVDTLLFDRLHAFGIEPGLIPGFIRSLANAFLVNPRMTVRQANKRLSYLGWNEIELDYHTFLLARLAFEANGLSRLEYRPALWYAKRFDARRPSSPGHGLGKAKGRRI